MKHERLYSLDVLRGIDMFYLAALSSFLGCLFRALGKPAWAAFANSHPWIGFTAYDLIMPLFIFMSGAAAPFALKSRLDERGRPTAAFHRHVWFRFAWLWVLGMVVQGGLLSFVPAQTTLFSNTLQCIAIGYVSAAYLLLCRSWTVRLAIPLALVVAYGLIVHLGGDYTREGNVTMKFEMWLLAKLPLSGAVQTDYVRKYGYTWYLPAMMFPVIGLAGAYASEVLRCEKWAQMKRAGVVGAAGAAAWCVGRALEAVGVTCVKHFFSISFTLQAIGISTMMLAALYYVCDIRKWRRGTGLLIAFGQSALVAYLCEGLFRSAVMKASESLFGGLAHKVGQPWEGVVVLFGFALVVTAVVYVWRGFRRKDR